MKLLKPFLVFLFVLTTPLMSKSFGQCVPGYVRLPAYVHRTPTGQWVIHCPAFFMPTNSNCCFPNIE